MVCNYSGSKCRYRESEILLSICRPLYNFKRHVAICLCLLSSVNFHQAAYPGHRVPAYTEMPNPLFFWSKWIKGAAVKIRHVLECSFHLLCHAVCQARNLRVHVTHLTPNQAKTLRPRSNKVAIKRIERRWDTLPQVRCGFTVYVIWELELWLPCRFISSCSDKGL